MAFPQAFLDELIARNPIEEVVGQYVQLKRSGANYFGLCPFHGEKTPSFSVAPNKQMYYCFGCHKGGGVINFIMEIESLSYPDAVRFLAQRVNLEVPDDRAYQSQYKEQERLIALCKDAARFFHERLKGEEGARARAYLIGRGLDWSTVQRFGIGYAPDDWQRLSDEMERRGYTRAELLAADLAVNREKNGKTNFYDKFRDRVMFPLIDVRGNVIAFSGRVLDGERKPKYMNSGETLIFQKRKFLYAMNLVKKSKQGRIILCEGPLDVIACHQFGFDCAVASQGTALTEEQVNIISKYTDQVIMTYDSDSAGQNATQRAINLFAKAGVRVKILRLNGAKDPDEYLRKYGADSFAVLLQESENQADYRLLTLQSQFDLSVDEQRVEFSQKAAELISTFQNSVEREIYADRAAQAAGISKEAMLLEVGKAYKKRIYREKRQKEKIGLSPVTTIQPKSRQMHYDNIRSARAEESLLAQSLMEPALLDRSDGLTGEAFSSPVLGRAFDALLQRHRQGLAVSLAVLEGFSQEEMSHLSAVCQGTDRVAGERAYDDCVAIVREEHRKARQGNSESDLLDLQARLKTKKGYGG